MRVLILNTYYPDVIKLAEERNPGLEHRTYAEQLTAYYDIGFARSDWLQRNLRILGHEADEVITNAMSLQSRWAKEHGMQLPFPGRRAHASGVQWNGRRIYRGLRRRLGFYNDYHRATDWECEVVAAQVEEFSPDLIFNCDVQQFPPKFLRQLRRKHRHIVGECGYPIPLDIDLRPYDLILTCIPYFVERFKTVGVPAEIWRHGFESSILDRLPPRGEPNGAVFVGGVGSYHRFRVELLQAVSEKVPLRCFGFGAETLPATSVLRQCARPPVWGYDMYREFAQAKLALNIHGEVVGDFAANMRMYEATGAGTLLITDFKSNLHELFEIGKEVVAYHSLEECADLVNYYLAHETDREQIAVAGQAKTLSQHTFLHRMKEFSEIVGRYL